MNRNQKFIISMMWAVMVVAMICIVAYHMRPGREPEGQFVRISTAGASDGGDRNTGLPVLYDAPPFALTDQNNKPLTDQDLRGKVWIADFVFINCAGPCPMMSAKMSTLQKDIPDKNVRLVSFSVDPEHDTPAALKEYAKGLGADESRWSFLTSDDKKAIFAVAAGMHLTAMPAEGETPVIHDERFLLIDADGKVRGIYYSKDAEKMAKLLTDVATLTSGGKS